MISWRRLKLFFIIIIVHIVCIQCKKATKAPSKETNILKFFRLLLMRVIYGFASYMGFEDRLEDINDGALVPPGADDDYGDGGTKDYYDDDDDDGDYDLLGY